MKVATLKPDCRVCALDAPIREAVNGAIWDGRDIRVRGYRAQAVRVLVGLTGEPVDVRTITRHADHVERSWHETEGRGSMPPAGNEAPVFATDYASLVEQVAHAGVTALRRLEEKMATDALEPRELVAMAKMGVLARAQEAGLQAKSNRPQITIQAILGVAMGGFGHLPETEVLDVTPESELLGSWEEERAALKQLRAGEPMAGEFDGLV